MFHFDAYATFVILIYLHLFNIPHLVWSLCMTPDGRLVSGSEDEYIKIWDLNTGECQTTLKGHSKAGIYYAEDTVLHLVLLVFLVTFIRKVWSYL